MLVESSEDELDQLIAENKREKKRKLQDLKRSRRLQAAKFIRTAATPIVMTHMVVPQRGKAANYPQIVPQLNMRNYRGNHSNPGPGQLPNEVLLTQYQ